MAPSQNINCGLEEEDIFHSLRSHTCRIDAKIIARAGSIHLNAQNFEGKMGG